MATTNGSSGPKIIQWYVDTRRMWPVPKKDKPRDEVLEFKTVVSPLSPILESRIHTSPGRTRTLTIISSGTRFGTPILLHPRRENKTRFSPPQTPHHHQILQCSLVQKQDFQRRKKETVLYPRRRNRRTGRLLLQR